MSAIHDILQKVWGYGKFRPLQEDIILSVLARRDTLAILPTGGGKSICFQVPALAMEGICIVVTPLVALMRDQVGQLKKRGINAEAVFSGMHKREIDIVLDNCAYGNTKFLYVSPERLLNELFLERVKKMKICLLAIDEAHCISQWGYDFRPPYIQIKEFRDFLPAGIPCIALTASATEPVQIDIAEKLGFADFAKFKQSFARKNLSYSVRQTENKEAKLLEIFAKVPGTAIVYVRSRAKTEKYARFFKQNGLNADYYHAGLGGEIRAAKQQAWISGKTRIIVATNAFGMGIDKPDVRIVVHIDIPECMEAYYQEAGRGGRDGRLAYAVLLLGPSDAEIFRQKFEENFPKNDRLALVYQSLGNFYKLAVGSGNGQPLDFDLALFSKTFGYSGGEAFHCLKKLEEAGLVAFDESFYSPSKLHWECDATKLYEFQVAQAQHEPLIKLLLRMYGGALFAGFVTVSEKEMAKALQGADEETIKRHLALLGSMGILSYQPKKDEPQLTFCRPREAPQGLSAILAPLKTRREGYEKKSQEMAGYVENSRTCRNILLLAYFGELSYQKCGLCDVCVEEKKNGATGDEISGYEDKIIAYIENKAASFKEISAFVKPGYSDKFTEVLRLLLDEGKIIRDADGLLALLDK